jgi:phage terminase small subunit
MIEDRHSKLIKNLPKHNYHVMPAAIEAGFTRSTAAKQGKRLLRTAVKREARKTLATLEGTDDISTTQLKSTLADLLGMSSEEVFSRLKDIALNDRDYNAALKVLKPLAKDLGVDLSEEEQTKVNVPILNVTVKENHTLLDGSVEPLQ